MTSCRILGVAIAILGFLGSGLFSRPHHGEIFELRQPDGSLVDVRVWGDEFYQRVESPDGYTLTRDPESGWIHYADVAPDRSHFVPSGYIYRPVAIGAKQAVSGQNAFLNAVGKRATLSSAAIEFTARAKRAELGLPTLEEEWADFQAKKIQPLRPKADTVYGLTLLISFPDESSSISGQQIENFFNREGDGDYGSVADFFKDVSGNRYVYFNRVTEYVTVSNNKSYYDTPNGYGPISELLTDALSKASSNGFDFSGLTTDGNGRVIAFNALYAGKSNNGWANGLWPHSGSYNGDFSADGIRFRRYQLSGIGENGVSLGTIIHENGHMLFGWPDLYSYENHSNGVGRFCVMNSLVGRNPQMPNPYFRSLEGWISLTDISDAPQGGLYTATANDFHAFIFNGENNGGPNETFFIEARLKEGRSAEIPDEGLAIWHVDRDGTNTRAGGDLLVALEQADGDFDMENRENQGDGLDLFTAGGNSAFYDETSPSAEWNSGSASGLHIDNISEPGEEMTFSIGPDIIEVGTEKPENSIGFRVSVLGDKLFFAGMSDNIKIYSPDGNLMFRGNVAESGYVNISQFSPGLYVIVSRNFNAKFTK